MAAKQVVIIGAGPAGLTAAHELLRRGGCAVRVLEATEQLGGLARTEQFCGNRIDIGGHRFFSKSQRVMDWWRAQLPPDTAPLPPDGSLPDIPLHRFLLRSRKSRIYWNARLFDYPVSLSVNTLRNLGPAKLVRAGLSYARALCRPIRPERSLEDFFINRFGRELYATFFCDYTRKVWGIPCDKLSPDWGAQRVKGLSILKVLLHALRPKARDLAQKDVETSLIGQFLYPPHGPGQLWETVADQIRALGGEILTGQTVMGLETTPAQDKTPRVRAVLARDASGATHSYPADAVFSSMPVRALAAALGDALPEDARALAASLTYRDFVTVGLLVNRLRLTEADGAPLRDNWIYVHDTRVQVGRLQFFRNWSPWMVADAATHWIGLEYFCAEGDALWNLPEDQMITLAAHELDMLGIADAADVRGGCRIHAPKAYPVYIGEGYTRFAELRRALDTVDNLYLIGRNGMHRYNNMDHSMLAAFAAVDAFGAGAGHAAVWTVNAEADYHEEGGKMDAPGHGGNAGAAEQR